MQCKYVYLLDVNHPSIFGHMIVYVNNFSSFQNVATPLWGKCEVATHTTENGTWESFGIPKNLKRDCRGQITSH